MNTCHTTCCGEAVVVTRNGKHHLGDIGKVLINVRKQAAHIAGAPHIM